MMAIQAIPERWTKTDAQMKGDSSNNGGSGKYQGRPYIRRPTRGIVLKEDTFATIRVVTGAGEDRWLVDAGSRRDSMSPLSVNGKTTTNIYSNFFLQQISEERMEKQQVLETFGEPYIFLFGERARMMAFSGILINTQDFNWEAEWWDNYNNELRGTKCVENDARVFLQFDDTLISGYILSANAQKNAQERNWVNFSFQMFITTYTNIKDIGRSEAHPYLGTAGVTKESLKLSDNKPWRASWDSAGKGLANMRPNLLADKFDPSTDGSTTFGKDVSLVDALKTDLARGLSAITKGWNMIDNAINRAEVAFNGRLNGDLVRVPFGFQGALAFDAAADVTEVKTYWGEQITYTVFQDNDDEYVGIGDQYASSATDSEAMKFVRFLGNDSFANEKDNASTQLAKAMDKWKASWAANGLNVPEFENGAMARVLKDATSVGLTVAAGVQNWAAYLQAPQAGQEVGPFAAVIAP
jgi:hypothetical protein